MIRQPRRSTASPTEATDHSVGWSFPGAKFVQCRWQIGDYSLSRSSFNRERLPGMKRLSILAATAAAFVMAGSGAALAQAGAQRSAAAAARAHRRQAEPQRHLAGDEHRQLEPRAAFGRPNPVAERAGRRDRRDPRRARRGRGRHDPLQAGGARARSTRTGQNPISTIRKRPATCPASRARPT